MSTSIAIHKVKAVKINNRVFNGSGKKNFETIQIKFTDDSNHEVTIDIYSSGNRFNLGVIKAFTINGNNSEVIDS